MTMETLILNRSILASLMNLDDYISGIEDAFRNHGLGNTFGNQMIHGDTPGELEFHIKSGGLILNGKKYYGLKMNASNFLNSKVGLPNIMGVVLLYDGERGKPLAIVDAGEPTINRTGAATAVAAKYLAKKNSKVCAICGCGKQGRIQLKSLLKIFPLQKCFAFDVNSEAAKRYAEEMTKETGIKIVSVVDLKSATLKSDIVVSCTPSKKPYIFKDFIAPGTFISAIGADSPDKQELDAQLLKGNKIVVDIYEQCAKAGELHHALEEHQITNDQVHGTLGEVVAGIKPGRSNDEEIIIFDATGTAIQDVAAAATCYEKALEKGLGIKFDFFA